MSTNTALGLDVAKDSAVFELLRADGIPLAKGSLKPSREAVASLLQTLARLAVSPADCPVAIESTGGFSQAWADSLLHAGFPVYVVNPLVTKTLKAVDNAVRQKKSDPVDAHALAEAMCIHRPGLVRFRHLSPDAGGVLLRKFASIRHGVRKSLTALMKSTGAALHLSFPGWRECGISLTSTHDLRLLVAAPSAPEIAAMSESRLAKFVGAKAAPAVRAVAKNTFADEAVARAVGIAVAAAVKVVIVLREQLAEITRAARAALADLPQGRMETRLRTLPGLGKLTAPVVAAYLPEGFVNWHEKKRGVMNKLAAHFGIEPREHSSGPNKGRSRMSKRGSPLARTALFQSACMATLHDGDLKTYYRSLRDRGKPHKAAIVDVMRKLVRKIVCLFWDEHISIPNGNIAPAV